MNTARAESKCVVVTKVKAQDAQANKWIPNISVVDCEHLRIQSYTWMNALFYSFITRQIRLCVRGGGYFIIKYHKCLSRINCRVSEFRNKGVKHKLKLRNEAAVASRGSPCDICSRSWVIFYSFVFLFKIMPRTLFSSARKMCLFSQFNWSRDILMMARVWMPDYTCVEVFAQEYYTLVI